MYTCNYYGILKSVKGKFRSVSRSPHVCVFRTNSDYSRISLARGRFWRVNWPSDSRITAVDQSSYNVAHTAQIRCIINPPLWLTSSGDPANSTLHTIFTLCVLQSGMTNVCYHHSCLWICSSVACSPSLLNLVIIFLLFLLHIKKMKNQNDVSIDLCQGIRSAFSIDRLSENLSRHL